MSEKPTDRRTRRGRRRPRPATPRSLEAAALYYLQRFATSSENLRRVLMRRVHRSARLHGTDPAEGAAVVDRLVARYLDSGLLDDRAYAEGRTLSLHRRGTPPRAIRAALRAKGVEDALIDAVLAELEAGATPDAELAAACAYVRRRRLGPFRPPQERSARRERDLAAMGRAGFSLDVAKRVLSAADPEEVDALGRE